MTDIRTDNEREMLLRK